MKITTIEDLEGQLDQAGISLKQIELLYPKIVESFMPLSITGVSPRTYFHWKKAGLIHSYSVAEESEEEEEREWVRLNLIDYIWIKIIQVMRDFGIPIKTIKETKEWLYSNYIESLLEEKDDGFNFLDTESTMDPKKIALIKSAVTVLSDEIKNLPVEFEKYYSLIGGLIAKLLLENDKGSIIIRKIGDKFKVDYFSYTIMSEFQDISQLLECPHIQIPIRKLVEEFFDNPKSEKFVDRFELLSQKEKTVINAIRKKDFKEIIIKQDSKNESIVIEIEKDGSIVDQKAKEVKRILGLNEYSEVTIKFRNDKHLYFKNKTRL